MSGVGCYSTQRHSRLFFGLFCTVVPVDLVVAERAAAIRADYGLRTPDVLICATALCSAAALVGNDQRWKKHTGSGLSYVHIDDVVAASGHG